MMIKFCLIFLSLRLCLAEVDVCNAIPQNKEIDWSKMENTTWYQVLNAGDAEDEAVKCHVIQFLKSDKTTIDLDFVLLDGSDTENVVKVRQQFIKSGKFYSMNRAYEWSWIDIALKRGMKKSPKLIAEEVQVLEDHFEHPIALYTDYETYFIGTICIPDNHYVFIYASTPRLTTPDALKIFNTLVRSNSAVELNFSGCKDIATIET